MGKFTNTTYVNTIDSLVDATKSKLNNPYYIFSDQKPTKVTYYSQNIERSTLDEASGLYGSHVGKDSPFQFNKIIDFILYGLDKISAEYDVGEYGTEANTISGGAIVLPNTITPRPGDFFSIPYVKETLLFKVNGVTIDTLDTGANIYKIEYTLELTNAIDTIEKQVIKKFRFIAGNVGTDFKTIIEDCDYELIRTYESLVNDLINYFQTIFFDSKLQTFVYNHDGYHMYDPFLIEFLVRNGVLKYGDEYIYVSHATTVNKTFSMDYNKSFFRCLEDKDISELDNCKKYATADLITDPNSLFVTRMEYYYSVRYNDPSPFKTRFTVFDPDVIEHIKTGTYYEMGDTREVYNLWIAYFNNDTDFIRGGILNLIAKFHYMDNLAYFYIMPISIFIIEKYIEILAR